MEKSLLEMVVRLREANSIKEQLIENVIKAFQPVPVDVIMMSNAIDIIIDHNDVNFEQIQSALQKLGVHPANVSLIMELDPRGSNSEDVMMLRITTPSDLGVSLDETR